MKYDMLSLSYHQYIDLLIIIDFIFEYFETILNMSKHHEKKVKYKKKKKKLDDLYIFF